MLFKLIALVLALVLSVCAPPKPPYNPGNGSYGGVIERPPYNPGNGSYGGEDAHS